MMKWWGWGAEGVEFSLDGRPQFIPWASGLFGSSISSVVERPVSIDHIQLAPPRLSPSLRNDLKLFRPDQLSESRKDRIAHSTGKSFPNLLKIRRGEIPRAPDLILYPETHEEVEEIVRLARRHSVTLIPFGGGTNIVGGVDPTGERTVLTINLCRMNRVLSVDAYSHLATVQAGALGPKLEADLSTYGVALGHIPDSFEFSTLGGWIATRSAGMQSDGYGKIEDMVVSVKVVTPRGTLVTKCAPRAATGPSLLQLIVGSEGNFGIITEATVRVHPVPQRSLTRAFFVRSFEEGVSVMRECATRGSLPTLTRLSDEMETSLILKLKRTGGALQTAATNAFLYYLRKRGFERPCMMMVGIEGDLKSVRSRRASVDAVLRSVKAFSLGESAAASWSRDKFKVPYLRDFLMDRGVMVDVAETSTSWTNLLPLYRKSARAFQDQLTEEGQSGYLGCHVSHSYETGASLYFTFAALQKADALAHYYRYKNRITSAFVEGGGTLSHHHAVGIEHRPWIEQELSPLGVTALRGLKRTLDPTGIMNPGKLIPPDERDSPLETDFPSSLRPGEPSEAAVEVRTASAD